MTSVSLNCTIESLDLIAMQYDTILFKPVSSNYSKDNDIYFLL